MLIHPVFGSLRVNEKGYLRINAGPHRDQYLHRAVWERVAEKPLPPGWHVHHMGPKKCACPHQLVALPAELHAGPQPLRCPFTGVFLSVQAYERRFGESPRRCA